MERGHHKMEQKYAKKNGFHENVSYNSFALSPRNILVRDNLTRLNYLRASIACTYTCFSCWSNKLSM